MVPFPHLIEVVPYTLAPTKAVSHGAIIASIPPGDEFVQSESCMPSPLIEGIYKVRLEHLEAALLKASPDSGGILC